MRIDPFQSERLLSLWQNKVDYDFTETGVHPMFLHELVSREELDEIYASVQLRYIQTDGSPPLKEAICGLYEACCPENLLVTNGSAEANFLAVWHLVEPGDRVVAVLPNYMQVPGVARAFGAEVVPVYLRPERAWELDLEELEAAVRPGAKILYVTNPNNPTGAILSAAEMDAVVAAAEAAGAWLLADEVYRGAELDGESSPSFWGRYHKTIVVGGLSKALHAAGLRLGWVLTDPELAATLWGYHDYTTISTNAVSERPGAACPAAGGAGTYLGAQSHDLQAQSARPQRLARRPRRYVQLRPSAYWRRGLRGLQPAPRFHRAGHAPAPRTQRTGRARRSLRCRSVPAHRLREPAPARGARLDQ